MRAMTSLWFRRITGAPTVGAGCSVDPLMVVRPAGKPTVRSRRRRLRFVYGFIMHGRADSVGRHAGLVRRAGGRFVPLALAFPRH